MADQGAVITKDMLFQFRISNIHLSSSKKHLEPKLFTTQLYTWLMNLNYTIPMNKYDSFVIIEHCTKDLSMSNVNMIIIIWVVKYFAFL